MNLVSHIEVPRHVLEQLTPEERRRLESAIDLPSMVRHERELSLQPPTEVVKPATRSRFSLDFVI